MYPHPIKGCGFAAEDFIKSLGYSRLDYLIATHPHDDHIGGLPDVINTFSIGNVYMPRTSKADTPSTATYRNLLMAIKNKGLSVHEAKAGISIIQNSQVTANFIAPCGTNYGDLNQYSAVLMLQYGEKRFLFTGDAGNISEDQITANVKADVLKVGHHGSRTATGIDFLNKVHPQYAVIEVGKGNKYGHPTNQTLSRLHNIGATIYRTDVDGSVVFTSDGKTIAVNKQPSNSNSNSNTNTSNTSSKSTWAHHKTYHHGSYHHGFYHHKKG